MPQLLLHYSPLPAEIACGLCGAPTLFEAGTQLVLAESQQPVCEACGKQHAPPLAALLQLANEAERVGRIGRHTVFPPYTALLDLARAADNYAASQPDTGKDGS
jgi:hypothetical protein